MTGPRGDGSGDPDGFPIGLERPERVYHRQTPIPGPA